MSKIPKNRIIEEMSKEKSLEFKILKEFKPRYNKKFKRTEKSLNFKIVHNLNQYVNLLLIEKEINSEFKKLIDKAIKDVDTNYYMSIEISSVRLEIPIYISPRKIKDFKVETIFQRIFKFNQSFKDLFKNDELNLNIILAENIKGAGRIKKATRLLSEVSKKKTSVITIKNNDNSCAFRALYVSKYYLDNKNNLSKSQWQKVRADKQNVQTRGANRVREECKMDKIESVGYEEWKEIQKFFPDYQICIIDATYKKNFIFRGENKDKRLYIEYLDEHYNSIINIQGYMKGKYYCAICHIGFYKLFDHRCKFHCKQCYGNCENSENKITCSDCNRDFNGLVCFNNHLKSGKMCSIIKKCKDCNITFKRKHKCKQYNCQKCTRNYTEQPHFCFIKPADTLKLTEEDQINKIIVAFDIESTQENGEHIPNLLICKTKCDKCFNSIVNDCNVCKITKPEIFGKNCVKDFVKYLFIDLARHAEKNKSMVYCFAHNARGYDSQFLLRQLWNLQLENVEVIMRGRKILMIRSGNVKVLDSLNFFLQPLSKLPKALGLDVTNQKGDFPYLFNIQSNYDYEGEIPDLKYFGTEYMPPEKKIKLEEWHETEKVSKKTWNFKSELINYCQNDVNILMSCIMKFREVFKNITNLDPITRAFTLASIGLEVFKSKYLNEKELAITPTEGYTAVKNYSISANCWLDWIEKTNGVKLKREFRIGKYWVDAYDINTNTVYEYNGCYFHGHDCDPNNELNPKRMADINERLNFINNSEYKLITIWDCEYKKLKQNDKICKDYFNKRYVYYLKLRKNGNVEIRDSFFGGRTNNIKFFHNVNQEEEIKYLDVCSLYPYVLKNYKYPISHPILIRENFDYTLQSYFGFVKCQVEAPRKLYLPVLPLVLNDKLFFPLCVSCAEEKCIDCVCTDRSMVNTWTSEELKLAISKGYKITEIFEVLHYPENATSSELFKKYVDMWLKIKQESSGWPSWCLNEEDKQRYIEEYLTSEKVQLEYDKIEKNEALRFIAKIMLNSFWGKLAQRPNQPRTAIINTYDEYFDLITDSDKEITGEIMVTDDVLILTWEYIEPKLDIVKNYNIAVGSYVTAYARMKLYSIMEEIETIRPKSLLYHDTDSVMYIKNINDREIECGDYLGDLTDEIEKNYGKDAKCTQFVSLGPKNYAYIVDVGNGNFKAEIKCKGISLCYNARQIISFEKMMEMAKNFNEEDKTDEIVVPQRQFTLNKHCQIFTRYFDKIYKAVSDKRYIEGDTTFPYGY